MDGGPFRSQRPADRATTSRAESTRRQPEEPEPVKEVPAKIVHRTPASHRAPKEENSLKRFLLPVIAIIIVVIISIAGWFAWSNTRTVGTAIDDRKYQAVFFTNGQVYFGKLQVFNNEYLKLTDIYYLQTQTGAEGDSENPQETTSDQNNVQLIKLGDEIHGPEDEMIISKDQVLFYENLKPDGKVAQSIDKYKKSD